MGLCNGIVYVLTAVVLFIPICHSRTPVTVDTQIGRITGFYELMTIDGQQKVVSQFLGIPYAESTAGKNRFMKPVPKAPFDRTIMADKKAMACYQYLKEYTNFYTAFVPGFSEDCLSLNIYVPHAMKSNDLLPVMIWIHGGGFNAGSAMNYHPEVLSSFGEVIVVTVNYRLGMFGFLRDRNGHFPGNQGLWDQQLAIKWVHENIESFLGYKDEVTIFGESAGAASVLFQALYPGNNGLFKRVIAESGSSLAYWAIANISKQETYLTGKNCPVQTPNIVRCMQVKTVQELLSNATGFAPTVDNDFLAGTPDEIVKGNLSRTAEARNFFASLDIIVGVNDKDGGGLASTVWQALLGHNDTNLNISRDDFVQRIIPWTVDDILLPEDDAQRKVLEELLEFVYTNWENPDDYVSIEENVVDMATDGFFLAPAVDTLRTHAQLQQGRTYFYEFAVKPETNILPVPSWFKGSSHLDEIPYVFGTPLRNASTLFGSHFNFTAGGMQISRATMSLWSNFAKSGDPNVPMNTTNFIHSSWPEYTLSSEQYLRISNNLTEPSVRDRIYPKRMQLWRELIPHLKELHHRKKEPKEIVHFDPTSLVG